jgi:hypothetical protein
MPIENQPEGNDPASIVARLKAKLPQQPQAAAAQQTGQPSASDDEQNLPDEAGDEAAASTVNLGKLYSKLNSAIAEMFDGLGVKRNLTIPHQGGQNLSDHVADVAKAAAQVGGLSKNFVTVKHTVHDPDGGSTVLHPSDKLRETVVPANNELARTAIAACQTIVNKIEGLVPDAQEPVVQTARAQFALVAKLGGKGMSAWDLGAALISIPHPLLQLVARLHSKVKHQQQAAAPQGEEQPGGGAPAPEAQAQ